MKKTHKFQAQMVSHRGLLKHQGIINATFFTNPLANRGKTLHKSFMKPA